jgi:hypothetical protein
MFRGGRGRTDRLEPVVEHSEPGVDAVEGDGSSCGEFSDGYAVGAVPFGVPTVSAPFARAFGAWQLCAGDAHGEQQEQQQAETMAEGGEVGGCGGAQHPTDGGHLGTGGQSGVGEPADGQSAGVELDR